MKTVCALALSITAFASFGQTGSDIYVFQLTAAAGQLSLSNPQNITNHVGYDNQPSFSGKGKLFYASFNDDGRSDLRQFDFKKNTTMSLTKTLEREYSPTLTPDRKHVSCIIQRDNGAQDLGMYPLTGGPAKILINDLIVGYHAWVDAERVLIFVLGEPNTLQLYNINTKQKKIVAERVGRSLHKIPGQQAMSFVHKLNEPWKVMRWDVTTGVLTEMGSTLPGREDMTWLPDGTMIMSDGQNIFERKPQQSEWKPLKLKEGKESMKGISRLAASPKGDQLAVVVAE